MIHSSQISNASVSKETIPEKTLLQFVDTVISSIRKDQDNVRQRANTLTERADNIEEPTLGDFDELKRIYKGFDVLLDFTITKYYLRGISIAQLSKVARIHSSRIRQIIKRVKQCYKASLKPQNNTPTN